MATMGPSRENLRETVERIMVATEVRSRPLVEERFGADVASQFFHATL